MPVRAGRVLVAVLLRIVVVAFVIEAASYACFWYGTGHPFTYARLDEERRSQITAAAAVRPETLATDAPGPAPHPFMGFTYNPRNRSSETFKRYGMAAPSDWGFVDDKSPIQAAATDRVIVGVFGGSVAAWTSMHGIDALRAAFEQTRAFRGKSLVFVRAGIGAFKQPQQLMTLTYLLALGAHFDVVVNLDGFNEMVLPVTDNVPQGYFPFFPQHWPGLLGALGGTARARLVGEITYLEATRGGQAAYFSRPLLRRSIFANTLWTMLDRRTDREIAARHTALAAQKGDAKALPYGAVGPPRPYANADAMYSDFAEVWMRSSLAMHRLSEAHGIKYFHFLQPNQYVRGAKPMGSLEAARALLPGSATEQGVLHGYPKLIAKGRELDALGVDFEDLTQIFAGIERPLYVDNCCHLSAEGSGLLARHIGDHVRRAIDREPHNHSADDHR